MTEKKKKTHRKKWTFLFYQFNDTGVSLPNVIFVKSQNTECPQFLLRGPRKTDQFGILFLCLTKTIIYAFLLLGTRIF